MTRPTSFRQARIRRESLKLATEVNPATLEAMRLANVELENKIRALTDLHEAEQQLRAAVHEWFMREEQELVVDVGGAVFLGLGQCPVTLCWLRENDKLALHFWAFEGALVGRLPRYLCDDCKNPECGGEITCAGLQFETSSHKMTEQEWNNHLLNVRMPGRVKRAMQTVVDARKRVG